MLVQVQFVFPVNGRFWLPIGAFFDKSTGHVCLNLALRPIDALDPLRSQQDPLTRPKIPRVNDRVANCPSLVVE
jgi:hypothetical protein